MVETGRGGEAAWKMETAARLPGRPRPGFPDMRARVGDDRGAPQQARVAIQRNEDGVSPCLPIHVQPLLGGMAVGNWGVSTRRQTNAERARPQGHHKPWQFACGAGCTSMCLHGDGDLKKGAPPDSKRSKCKTKPTS